MALPPPSESSTCLVTGAPSGIGEALARELASRGRGVTLTARRKERLVKLASELTDRYGVRAEVVACDLSSAAARRRMIKTIADRGLEVEVLVNNAGFGSAGRFQDLDGESEVQMVRTNVEAVVDLCAIYVQQMVARPRGRTPHPAPGAPPQPGPPPSTHAAPHAVLLRVTGGVPAHPPGPGVADP